MKLKVRTFCVVVCLFLSGIAYGQDQGNNQYVIDCNSSWLCTKFLDKFGPLNSDVIGRNHFKRLEEGSNTNGTVYLFSRDDERSLDSYSYGLLLSESTCDVFFVRYGGYFGVRELYGPINLPINSARCLPQKQNRQNETVTA